MVGAHQQPYEVVAEADALDIGRLRAAPAEGKRGGRVPREGGVLDAEGGRGGRAPREAALMPREGWPGAEGGRGA